MESLNSVVLSRKCLNLRVGLAQATASIEELISSLSVEDVTVLDRIVSEFSFHLLYLKELGLESIAEDQEIGRTACKLEQFVSTVFLQALKDGDSEAIVCCLRMFVNLDAIGKAEGSVRESIVRPRLTGIFNQKKLEGSKEDLKGLFDEALVLLQEDLKLLLEVLKEYVTAPLRII